MSSYASDGDCDGGGPGAEYLGCQLGTDCAGADCGPRFRLPQPHAPPIRAETCNWASDGPIATTAAPARSSARGPGTNSKVCVCTYSKHTFTNQPTAMRHGHAWGPHSKVSRGKNPFFSRLDPWAAARAIVGDALFSRVARIPRFISPQPSKTSQPHFSQPRTSTFLLWEAELTPNPLICGS